MLLLAATVVVAVATIATLGALCPFFISIAAPLALIAIAGLIVHACDSFKGRSNDLKWKTDRVKELQGEVDSFKEFMDAEGSKLKLRLEEIVLLMNPTTKEEYLEKARIETAINDLRLGEVLIASLAETDSEV